MHAISQRSFQRGKIFTVPSLLLSLKASFAWLGSRGMIITADVQLSAFCLFVYSCELFSGIKKKFFLFIFLKLGHFQQLPKPARLGQGACGDDSKKPARSSWPTSNYHHICGFYFLLLLLQEITKGPGTLRN